MNANRRLLLCGVFGMLLSISAAMAEEAETGGIDREALVKRHDVHVSGVDPWSPLSVGNGDFAFTVDATGLQTFEDHYYENGIPLETLSNWGWHSFPNPDGLTLEQAKKIYKVHGREIAFASLQDSPAGDYFRKNPHRIPLGQLGLLLVDEDGEPIGPEDLGEVRQTLELWTGRITSRYTLGGVPVMVETVCHPTRDIVGVRITSPLLGERLHPRIRFPYAHDERIKNKPPLDWSRQDRHRTVRVDLGEQWLRLDRELDESRYHVGMVWQGEADWREAGPHEVVLTTSGRDRIAFVCEFSPVPSASPPPSFEETRMASAGAWARFWSTGGAIDLSGSTDPRAPELERRIVLSQYLTRIQCAGAFPPQETGLTHISWYGKHHTEMIWWHAAHFALWGRSEILERHLDWYRGILPEAKELARAQGYDGARWPKMTGPGGRPSPGTINPFIIWNQPHPISLSELVYRARPEPETLERYRDLVFESAAYLASYAHYNEAEDRYTLGPPIRSAGEDLEENLTRNPTFELAYWHYGLTVAQQWRERLGLARNPEWDKVLAKLSALPEKDGLYLDIETDPDCFERSGVSSHMLMALGVLPGGSWVDRETLERTYRRVVEINGRDSFVSWTSGKVAMTAARLGDPEMAVHILCHTLESNRVLPNGHVRRPKEPTACPAYLPVNGSLLAAAALMAAGWDGAPDVSAPGFPQDGSWTVQWEGLQRAP